MGVFDRLSEFTGGDSGADSAVDADEPAETDEEAPPTPADFRDFAEEVSGRSNVPTLDFTAASAENLDGMVGGASSPVEDPQLLGSYFGEVLVRVYGATWVEEDGDWQVEISLEDDSTTLAVFDAAGMALESGPVFEPLLDRLESEGATVETTDPPHHREVSIDESMATATTSTDEVTQVVDEDDPSSAPESPVDTDAPTDERTVEDATDRDESPATGSTADSPDSASDDENGDSDSSEFSDPTDLKEAGKQAARDAETDDDGGAGPFPDPGDIRAAGRAASNDAADADDEPGPVVDVGDPADEGRDAEPEAEGETGEPVTDPEVEDEESNQDRVEADGTDGESADPDVGDETDPEPDAGREEPAATDDGTDAELAEASSADGESDAGVAEADAERADVGLEVDDEPTEELILFDEDTDTGDQEPDASPGADGPDDAMADETGDEDDEWQGFLEDLDEEPADEPGEFEGVSADSAGRSMPPREEIERAAGVFKTAWPEHDFDFSAESLVRLDGFVDEVVAEDPDLGSLEASWADEDSGFDRLAKVGAYFGEVLVEQFDAEWVPTTDERGAVEITVDGDGTESVPVFEVARECLEGDGSFAYRFDALANQVGADVAARSALTVFERDPTAKSVDVIPAILDRAEAFAEERPEAPLEFSPASLSRVDDIAAAEFADENVADLVPADGSVPEDLRLADYVTATAAYYATVLVNTLDANWQIDGEVRVVVSGPGGPIAVDPLSVATGAVRGNISFETHFDRLTNSVGVEPDLEE